MSNLWAVLAASDGYYHFEIRGRTQRVDAANQRMFDKWALRYPFCPVAQKDGVFDQTGVVWVESKGKRVIENLRGFFRPPTVMFVKGTRVIALWAISPAKVRDAVPVNERLARLFKGKIKDSSPWEYLMDIQGCEQEWRMDAYYDLKEIGAFV